jgi:hypothetical protein
MAALTTAYEAKRTVGQQKAYKMAANTTIYKGALVMVNATGYAVPGADTAGGLFVGVAYETRSNGATAGATVILVEKAGEYLYNFGGTATQATVGQVVKISDDNTVHTTTANSVACGYVTEFVSASSVRVRIDRSVN